MARLFKTLIRVGVIAAVCAGAAVFIGEDRVSALMTQAHDSLVNVIDDNIDDPVALRSQLRELEKDYPAKISQVRGDLAELQEQIRQMEREQLVSERVVALADRDLDMIGPLLVQAQAQQAEKASLLGGDIQNVVSIRFEDRTFSLDQAQTRARQINQTRVAYANRAADAAHDMVYLKQQAERLQELLSQLETERTQFQSQLWQLDRQVDAIARNEKLIDMLEKRKQTIEECSRYEAVSLDHIVGRLNEVRARQQAELDVLTEDSRQIEYEDVARMQLDSESGLIELGIATDISADEGADVETLVYRGAEPASPRLR